ncbi:MAG: TIGR00730 family Rossman fold protein [Desulfobacteraceae bacterium]|nr:MAG: TIGR00730 family Rossman fold protein [Desulfobacteraceae bacterium]
MQLYFGKKNDLVDETIEQLLALSGGIRRPHIVRELILTALKAGQEDDGKVDLKLMNTTLKEMRYTAKTFSSYRKLKKVSVFGSARTGAGTPIYRMAYDLGRKLSQRGYMVITGGGPGIMQAVNEGAGPERSFGVSIRLPFEQRSNLVLDGNPKNIMYKYFFNRKVAFLKESDAIVLFPGGFGTLDEGMETLTLLQTGKRNPMPLLFIDEPGGNYWKHWFRFCTDELSATGYISASDFNLINIEEEIDAAVDRIDRFYYRYHSIRYIKDKVVLRLTAAPDQLRIQELKRLFADILTGDGDIYLSGPFAEETDEPEISGLPRLVIDFNRRDFGRLKCLVDAINQD